MLAAKAMFGLFSAKKSVEMIPYINNTLRSQIKLSEKRREEIEARRAGLKADKDDPLAVKLIIREILSYQPSKITLDDRYFELEQVLDEIQQAKATKTTDDLLACCNSIISKTDHTSRFQNKFVLRLENAVDQISQAQTAMRAKL